MHFLRPFYENSFSFLKLFLSTSTIHGLNHISAGKRHYLEISTWLILVIFSSYWVANLSNQALRRYVDNPTVISIERDYFSWNTSLPAVTICPKQKIDNIALERYLNTSNVDNSTSLRLFLESLAVAGYDNFDSLLDYGGIQPEEFMKTLLELQFDFNPLINTNEGDESKLQRTITEMGICYSFNSQLAVYNSPEYREESWGLMKYPEILVVHPLDGDVFINLVNIPSSYNLYIHGPYEVPDVTTKAITVQSGLYVQIYLTALSIFSTSRVKRLMPRQRKCKYYDESDLAHSPTVYSYVLCRIECRIGLAKQLCGCLPHFYRKLDGEKVCNVKGLHCLSNHFERLKEFKTDCNCLPNCDDDNYAIEYFDKRIWFTGSSLQFGLINCPRKRLKRDLIFGFTDVLVYIGGLTGLFLGCSVLSFIEIFYVFTFRLFWYIKTKR